MSETRGHTPRIVRSHRVDTDTGPVAGILPDLLQMLVPLRMAEMRPMTDESLRAMVLDLDLVSTIGSRGDIAMYGGGKTATGRRDASEARHAVVTALAVLALINPGGVTACGGHWCAEPPCLMCPETSGPLRVVT